MDEVGDARRSETARRGVRLGDLWVAEGSDAVTVDAFGIDVDGRDDLDERDDFDDLLDRIAPPDRPGSGADGGWRGASRPAPDPPVEPPRRTPGAAGRCGPGPATGCDDDGLTLREPPGYRRDPRGTWRYRDGGRAVPGARDITLATLYRFARDADGNVVVPTPVVRRRAELAWCAQVGTVRVRGNEAVVVVPAADWDARARIPLGLAAPELCADRLLDIDAVARLAGVARQTITTYLARNTMPAPVARLGRSPVWSAPIVEQWLERRPGQGSRPRRGRRRRRT